MKQHYIYINGKLDVRAGGPAGYLANLDSGLNLIQKHDNIDFIYNKKKCSFWQQKYNVVKYNKRLNDISYSDSSKLNMIIENINNCEKNFSIPSKISKLIDLKKVNTMHLHSTRDVINMYNFLKLNKKNVPILLTSHSPAISHKEMQLYVRECLNEEDTRRYCKAYEIFDETAYKYADALIFPCAEAIENYYNSWDKFEEITKNKDFYWLPTGAKALEVQIDKEEYRSTYNIPQDAFVISYIGRHDEGKGYDTLKLAAEKLMQKYDNLYILVGGRPAPIQPLEHSRWIEIGYTQDPASLLNASDLFVLPNKITFYDLILIEVLSVGIPVLCSYTGGNKAISKLTNGIVTYEYGVDTLISGVENILSMNKVDLLNMGNENKNCYSSNFTLEKFAANYCAIIEEIQQKLKFQ